MNEMMCVDAITNDGSAWQPFKTLANLAKHLHRLGRRLETLPKGMAEGPPDGHLLGGHLCQRKKSYNLYHWKALDDDKSKKLNSPLHL
jgi:hypothetical protein